MRLKLKNLFQSGEKVTLSSVADGAEGYVLAEMLAYNPSIVDWCYVARDSRRAEFSPAGPACGGPGLCAPGRRRGDAV